MLKLKKVGDNTYYLENPTNIGIYKENEHDIWLIDSGNDKDAGRNILKVIEENNWNVKGIINTHSNADHIGGNKIIQDRTNCKILSYNIEQCFTQYPILEPSFLYGGYPYKELTNKFLMAKPANKIDNIQDNLPEGLEYFHLPGHFFDMIGIKTKDDIYFLSDAIFSENTITKYHIFYIYNIEKYLETLSFLETLNGKLYILSHCEATDNIQTIIKLNRDKINEIANLIIQICKEKQTFEEILKKIFDIYKLSMNDNQYVLIGNTIKSYLSWLKNQGKMKIIFENNFMYWKSM